MSRLARYRSAITWLFVSMAYAIRHPLTTVRERIRRNRGQHARRAGD